LASKPSFSTREIMFVQVCTVCGQSKDAEAFAFRSQISGRRHRTCKACVADYGRKHYAANRASYVSRNNLTARAQALELKTRVRHYLLEHPCVDCGVADPLLLDFDHVDPATKRKTIHKLVRQAYSWQAVEAEIEKCRVRCANCHRRRTAAQFAWPRLTFKLVVASVVTLSASPPRLRLKRPEITRTSPSATELRSAETVAPGIRLCIWCGVAKLAEQFHVRSKKAGQRNSICIACFTGYRREHYRLNREEYVRRNARVQQARGQFWSRRLWEYLLSHRALTAVSRIPLCWSGTT
jgi:hypothetical protein